MHGVCGISVIFPPLPSAYDGANGPGTTDTALWGSCNGEIRLGIFHF